MLVHKYTCYYNAILIESFTYYYYYIYICILIYNLILWNICMEQKKRL